MDSSMSEISAVGGHFFGTLLIPYYVYLSIKMLEIEDKNKSLDGAINRK